MSSQRKKEFRSATFQYQEGAILKNFEYDAKAANLLDRILNIWPSIIRNSWKEKILSYAKLYAYESDEGAITEDIIFRAAVQALPKSYEPLLLRVKAPEEFERKKQSQEKVDESKWLIEVKRWDKGNDSSEPKPSKAPSEQNILAILTSPRKGGNTEILLDTFLEGTQSQGAKVEKFFLQNLKIAPCIGCMKCKEKDIPEICALKDDMSQIYSSFINADSVVLGFPIYTGRECSITSVFFDRIDALRSPLHFPKLKTLKRGAIIGTWGWPSNDAYKHIIEFQVILLKLFQVITVEIVTACGFWGEYYKKGIIRKDEKGLAEAYSAGKDFVIF